MTLPRQSGGAVPSSSPGRVPPGSGRPITRGRSAEGRRRAQDAPVSPAPAEIGQLSVDDVLELQVGRVPGIADVGRDASPVDGGRLCAWCAGPIPAGARVDAEVCGVVCRKRRWRFRRAVPTSSSGIPGTRPRGPRDASREDPGRPRRFAYADPPYPGLAGYYPERQEVDHLALIAELEAGYPDGWALSTSAAALRDVLAMCPASTRVCCWRRRTRPTSSRRALSAWEPLLVVGGRALETGVPQDLLDVLDYRGRYDAFPGALVGMKPPEFAVWLFRQLGARAGDELADLFPGSGAVSRAWELYTSRGPEYSRDASPRTSATPGTRAAAIAGDVPPVAEGAVPRGRGETSRLAGADRVALALL